MKKTILLLIMILVISVSYAQENSLPTNPDGTVQTDYYVNEENMVVEVQTTETTSISTFLDRLKDKTKSQNGICEDAEFPFKDADCELTTEAISCQDRCVFKEIWFAKLLILVGVVLLLYHKKDYNVFLIIIALLLIVNFGNTSFDLNDIELGDNLINIGDVQYTNDAREGNFIIKYGSYIWENNPLYGFFIGLFLVWVLFRFVVRRK